MSRRDFLADGEAQPGAFVFYPRGTSETLEQKRKMFLLDATPSSSISAEVASTISRIVPFDGDALMAFSRMFLSKINSALRSAQTVEADADASR